MLNPKPLRLTRAQVREIDRLSIERYHIPGVVLMENASRSVAETVWTRRTTLTNSPTPHVLILCGGGNNGGDGLAAARHLHNFGLHVTLGLTTDPNRYKSEALTNWQIVQAMGLPTFQATPESIANSGATLVLDAIFGTGLSEPPRAPFPALAQAIRDAGRPVVAIDLPSGLDCDTGLPLGDAIRANLTVTFVAEKAGFANPASKLYTGEVLIAGIGCPRELIEEVAAAGTAGTRPGRPAEPPATADPRHAGT